jgi:hypothetical protein
VSDDGERVGLDVDELPRAKDACRYIADSRLLRRIERMATRVMVREPNLPVRAGTLPFHLEPSDWRAGYLDVHEYDLPPDLFGDLKRATPQALLRDLFRPDPPPLLYHEREVLWTHDWAGTKVLKEAREARKRDPLPRLQPLIHEVTRIAEAWQQVVSERWKPILDDNEPRKRVTTFREPAQNW